MSASKVGSPLLSRRGLLAGLTASTVTGTWHAPRSIANADEQPLRSVAAWETLYWGVLNDGWYTSMINRSLSANSYMFYHLGYALDAATTMAQATEDIGHIEIALDYTENMISTAQPSYCLPDTRYQDQDYLGWIGLRESNFNQQVSLDEIICWRYVARMLRIIADTPTWIADPSISSRYNTILAFIEENIFDKWWERHLNQLPEGGSDGQTQIYRNRTHIVTPWAMLCLHLSAITPSATRAAHYNEVLGHYDHELPNFGYGLRDQFVPYTDSPSCYVWCAVWGRNTPFEDVNHGSHDVAYLVDAAEYGSEWTQADITMLVSTFNDLVWPSPGVYGGYVDGTIGTAENARAHDGWAKLGRFSESLQRRLEIGHEPSFPSNQGYRSCQYFANGAYNAMVLGATPGRRVPARLLRRRMIHQAD